MSKFKVGDKVVRTAPTNSDFHIECGGIYTVSEVNGLYIRVQGVNTQSYQVTSFELVNSVTPFSELKHWKQEALRMHYDGKPHGVIAEALGKPYFTITTHLRRYKPRYSKEVVEQHYNAVARTNAIQSLDVEFMVKEVPIQDRLPKRSTTPPEAMCAQYGTVRKKPTIFVIGDTQVKQGVSLEYIHWVGNYIAAKQPDIIVHIGDHYDMAALSSYDKGMLSAEGRRVKADIDAGDEALEILERYIKSAKGYNPRKVVTLGNHEDRINRFVNTHPEFDGYIGTDKLAFHKLGWEVSPFLTPVNIEGINFVHYIQNVMTGKPLSGTVVNMLKTVGESFVMGHKQVLEHTLRYLPLSGKPQIGIIVGACYDHDESYKGVQGNHHFRGCVMLYECQEGSAMSKPVSLQHMKELYEVSK